MNNSTISFRKIEAKDHERIYAITDNNFGKFFLQSSYDSILLNKDLNIVAENLDSSKIIGLSLNELINYKDIKNQTLRTELKKAGIQNTIIGKQSILCVEDKYRNIGIGSKLLDISVEILRNYTDIVISVKWKNEVRNSLLDKAGFERISEVKNYWYDESLLKKYNCSICGNPPCQCSANLYVLKNKIIKNDNPHFV